MGGVWERQIRTARNILSVLLDQCGSQLNDESLPTFMTEVEAGPDTAWRRVAAWLRAPSLLKFLAVILDPRQQKIKKRVFRSTFRPVVLNSFGWEAFKT